MAEAMKYKWYNYFFVIYQQSYFGYSIIKSKGSYSFKLALKLLDLILATASICWRKQPFNSFFEKKSIF